jgi:hypothetical protein
MYFLFAAALPTDRELRASGQPSDWPDTTSRGDGRLDASLAASASYRETLPIVIAVESCRYHPLESSISGTSYMKTTKHLNAIRPCFHRSRSILAVFGSASVTLLRSDQLYIFHVG